MTTSFRSPDDMATFDALLLGAVLIVRLSLLAVTSVIMTIIAGCSLMITVPALFVVFGKRD